jgi:hypothetical protein
LDDFLGGVDRSIINVQAGRNTTLIESRAQRLDESIHVLGREELAVTADARSIIEEGDEAGLNRGAFDLDIRAIERIGLPHFIGVGFGESQTDLVGALRFGLEQFEGVNHTLKAGTRHLGTTQESLLDAEAIKDRTFWSGAM